MAVFAGCSTPGANHVYLATSDRHEAIQDVSPSEGSTATVPNYLRPSETLLAFAYDPYTDHVFMRLAPGLRFRVIDRPARKVKRAFYSSALPPGGTDLAIRSRDRHLFVAHPTDPALTELGQRGEFIRTIIFQDLSGPPQGVAYDRHEDAILILIAGESAVVSRYSNDGRLLGRTPLDRPIAPGNLAFDADARETYAQLSDESAIGIFDEQGHLRRTMPVSSTAQPLHFDVGPRSLVRMF